MNNINIIGRGYFEKKNNSIFCYLLMFVNGEWSVVNIAIHYSHFTIHLFHHEESFGLLVLLGYDVTTFRPVTYQRSSLLRPSMEVSSRG